MKVAPILFKDDGATFVLCPYCSNVHKHGAVDVGMSMGSHCMKGDYEVGGAFDFKGVSVAMTRRTKDMERKRALRAAAVAASAQP